MPALLKVSASVRPSRVSIFQSLGWGRDVLSPKVGLTAGLGLDLQMWSPPGEWRRPQEALLSFRCRRAAPETPLSPCSVGICFPLGKTRGLV